MKLFLSNNWLAFVFLLPFSLLAQSGILAPELLPLDNALRTFAAQNGEGLSVAVVRNGRLVYARSFGTTAGDSIRPYHRFRIGQLSEPITATAAMALVEAGNTIVDKQILGPVGALDGNPFRNFTDTAFEDVLLRHLLAHRSGWDTLSEGSPLFATAAIARATNSSLPLNDTTTIVYHIDRGLDFLPGRAFARTSFNYLLTGSSISAIRGIPYAQFVATRLLLLNDVIDLLPGGNLREDRRVREVQYVVPPGSPAVPAFFDTTQFVSGPYGGFDLETWLAAVGWIATPTSLARWLVHFDGDNAVPDDLPAVRINYLTQRVTDLGGGNSYGRGWEITSSGDWRALGELPGTTAAMRRRSDGLRWVAVRNTTGSALRLDSVVQVALTQVNSWPAYDLFRRPVVQTQLFGSVSSTDRSLTLPRNLGGDGERLLVVLRADSSADHFPLDGRRYRADARFGAGDEIGPGSFVVVDTAATGDFTVTGLQPNTTYYYRVFSYKLESGNPLYLLPGIWQLARTAPLMSRDEALLRSVSFAFDPVRQEVRFDNLPARTSYSVYDALGRELVRGKQLRGSSLQRSVLGWRPGLYLVRVRRGQAELAWRFVKTP